MIYGKNKMNFVKIVILATIFIIKNVSSEKILRCMELAGNTGLRFPVYYNDGLSFFPETLSLKYQMKGGTWKTDEGKEWNIDLRQVDGNCASNGLIIPKVNRGSETVTVFITVFSDDSEAVIIDYFELHVKSDFEKGLLTIEGLVGVMDLNIQLSPDIQDIKFGKDPLFKYSQSLGKLKDEDHLCLKIFKTGVPVVVQVIGVQLKRRNIYDYNTFEITLRKRGSEDIKKTFLAKGYACTDDEKIPPAQVYTDEIQDDKEFPKARISIRDGSDLAPLLPAVKPSFDEFSKKSQIDGIVINSLHVVSIDPKDALLNNDGLMMFKLKQEKYICEDEYGSFVELRKAGAVVVEKRSKFVDSSKSVKQITVMFTGTLSQIEKCLNKK